MLYLRHIWYHRERVLPRLSRRQLLGSPAQAQCSLSRPSLQQTGPGSPITDCGYPWKRTTHCLNRQSHKNCTDKCVFFRFYTDICSWSVLERVSGCGEELVASFAVCWPTLCPAGLQLQPTGGQRPVQSCRLSWSNQTWLVSICVPQQLNILIIQHIETFPKNIVGFFLLF